MKRIFWMTVLMTGVVLTSAVGCKPRDAKKNALLMAPAPVSNSCGSNYMGSLDLYSGTVVVSGDTTGAPDLYTVCDGEGSPDHVWAFTITEVPVSVNFNLCSGYTGDPSLKVWDTCLGDAGTSEEPIACNDDYCGLGSGVDFTIDEPGTYYVIVDGHGSGNYGPYTLTGSFNSDK